MLTLLALLSVTPDPQSVAAIRNDVAFLASDSLAGRERGSDGGRAAAAFLAGQLRRIGWQPFERAYRHEFVRSPKRRRGRNRQPESPLLMQNVVAVSRPAATGERYLVVGAHYDHVGLGDRGGSFGPRGLVHNGADDNASGTAAVLDLARRLFRDPLPAGSRPIMLVLFDGEEGGLFGSQAFAQQHRRRIAAMINLDMVGMLSQSRVYVWGATTAPAFASALDRMQAATGLSLDRRAEHIVRSDHWSFYEHDIPYLMLHTGLHPDYHRPADDADRLNYPGLARIAGAVESLVRTLADPAVDLSLVAASKDLQIVPSPPWQPQFAK